jgi:hypothetical protein
MATISLSAQAPFTKSSHEPQLTDLNSDDSMDSMKNTQLRSWLQEATETIYIYIYIMTINVIILSNNHP